MEQLEIWAIKIFKNTDSKDGIQIIMDENKWFIYWKMDNEQRKFIIHNSWWLKLDASEKIENIFFRPSKIVLKYLVTSDTQIYYIELKLEWM